MCLNFLVMSFYFLPGRRANNGCTEFFVNYVLTSTLRRDAAVLLAARTGPVYHHNSMCLINNGRVSAKPYSAFPW
jgi:hypothetical protein